MCAHRITSPSTGQVFTCIYDPMGNRLTQSAMPTTTLATTVYTYKMGKKDVYELFRRSGN